MFVQLIGGFFAPGVFGGSGLELIIAGFGTVLFVAMSFVDFYTMPRRYNDDQYLVEPRYVSHLYQFICIHPQAYDRSSRRRKKRLEYLLKDAVQSVD